MAAKVKKYLGNYATAPRYLVGLIIGISIALLALSLATVYGWDAMCFLQIILINNLIKIKLRFVRVMLCVCFGEYGDDARGSGDRGHANVRVPVRKGGRAGRVCRMQMHKPAGRVCVCGEGGQGGLWRIGVPTACVGRISLCPFWLACFSLSWTIPCSVAHAVLQRLR